METKKSALEPPVKLSPYSLGKLIEWKHIKSAFITVLKVKVSSPLAGETNWMETQKTLDDVGYGRNDVPDSSLVGETNWMETLYDLANKQTFLLPTRWGN